MQILHSKIYGSENAGTPLLVFHGLFGMLDNWASFAKEFAEIMPTHLIDLRNHGKSFHSDEMTHTVLADDILNYMNFHNLQKINLLGHSLGGMSILNAIKNGLQVKKAVVIGSGNSVINIVNTFVEKIGLPNKVAVIMRNSFEKKYHFDMESFSAYVVAKEVKIPVLVIHDNDDDDIPISEAYHLAENLSDKEVLITNNLGHRKILGDSAVITKIIEFLMIKK